MRRSKMLNQLAPVDNLALLFNEYMQGLDTLALMADPCYTTMAEVRLHTVTKPRTKEAKSYRHCAKRHYELLILGWSLQSIHDNVLKAIALLEGFYATYDENLLAYAIENRLKIINEYGSDEESDWEEDGLDEQDKQKWKVTVKTDPESLKHYTLHEELGSFFGGESAGRGEYVGTSAPEDFYPNTAMVEQQSEFSFRKIVQGAWGANLVRVAEDGTTAPIPLADHIEDEMNTDIKAADVVTRFNGVLQLAWIMRNFFLKMDPYDLNAYSQVHEGLTIMRDVKLAPAS